MSEREVERVLQEVGDEREVDRAIRNFLQSPQEVEIMGEKYKSQERYDAAHTKQIKLKLNLKTDADILEQLKKCGNVQGYIKSLIRKDMRGE